MSQSAAVEISSDVGAQHGEAVQVERPPFGGEKGGAWEGGGRLQKAEERGMTGLPAVVSLVALSSRIYLNRTKLSESLLELPGGPVEPVGTWVRSRFLYDVPSPIEILT